MRNLRLTAIALGVLAMTHGAIALTGTPPGTGPALVDGLWLQGLSSGTNNTYVSGIKAAGTTQATATQLAAGIYFTEIDTVPASSGVALPEAVAGTELLISNTTSTTIVLYPAIANNGLTAAQDTINGSTSLSVTGVSGGTVSDCFSAKNGVWMCK